MLCVCQDRVIRGTVLSGFGSSLAWSGSGALQEVYGLKMLECIMIIHLACAILPEAAPSGGHFRLMIY